MRGGDDFLLEIPTGSPAINPRVSRSREIFEATKRHAIVACNVPSSIMGKQTFARMPRESSLVLEESREKKLEKKYSYASPETFSPRQRERSLGISSSNRENSYASRIKFPLAEVHACTRRAEIRSLVPDSRAPHFWLRLLQILRPRVPRINYDPSIVQGPRAFVPGLRSFPISRNEGTTTLPGGEEAGDASSPSRAARLELLFFKRPRRKGDGALLPPANLHPVVPSSP